MSDTKRYVLSQIGWVLLQFFAISLALYILLMWAIPADALQQRFSKSSEETLEQVRHELGMDRPLMVHLLQSLF